MSEAPRPDSRRLVGAALITAGVLGAGYVALHAGSVAWYRWVELPRLVPPGLQASLHDSSILIRPLGMTPFGALHRSLIVACLGAGAGLAVCGWRLRAGGANRG